MSTNNDPWPCAIHNPDNLEPSQFGDPTIWRPATPDETADVPNQYWDGGRWQDAAQGIAAFRVCHHFTYRIRLSYRPWPVAAKATPPDADDAIAPGQNPAQLTNEQVGEGYRLTKEDERFSFIDDSRVERWSKDIQGWKVRDYAHVPLGPHGTYRIPLEVKPEPAKAAEFPPPPVGHEWHNPGGMPADKLLEGWRLLVKQELGATLHDGAKLVFGPPGACLCNLEPGSSAHPLYTTLVPASTPFPPADLTDADPCPTSPPCGWVEVTSGARQKHDWMWNGKTMFSPDWCQDIGAPVDTWVKYPRHIIYRHPARMPKAEAAPVDNDAPNNPYGVDPRHIPAGYRLARKSEMDGKYNHSARAWSLTGERFVPVPGCFMEPSWTVVVPDSVHWQARAEKAEAILAECMAIMPHGHTPSHTLENLPGRIGDLAKQVAEECVEREKAEAALDASRADWHRLNTLLCESNDRVGKLESELASLKSRQIGVLLPITEPLPPVPEGCVRKFVDELMLTSKGQSARDKWFIDFQRPSPTPPDKRAEFEALWKKGAAAQLDWNREEDGQFTCELIELAFQRWLNAGGDN